MPLIGGPSAGVFSVQFRDRHNGIAVGGDFSNPTSSLGNAAWSSDGGPDVAARDGPPLGVPVGVGLAARPARPWRSPSDPSGSDVTIDAGRTWSVVRHRELRQRRVRRRTVACWASGAQGRVARLALSLRLIGVA